MPFIVFSLVISARNWMLEQDNRAEQRSFLTEVKRQVMIGGDVRLAFNDRTLIGYNGRTYYQLFNWIFEDGPPDQVVNKLIDRIAALSTRPESEWFPK